MTESRNHEWSWEGPLELLQPNLPAQAGSLEHAAQDCVQTAFEYLQERRFSLAACSSSHSVRALMFLPSCLALRAACLLRMSPALPVPLARRAVPCTDHGLCDLCPLHWCCSGVEVPSEGLSSPCSPLSYVAGTCSGFLRAAGRSQARSLGQQAEPACSGWLSCWCEGFVLSQAGCLGRVWGLEQKRWAGLSSSTSVSSRTGGNGRSSGHRRAGQARSLR